MNPQVAANRPLAERLARPNDPSTWGTFQEAVSRYQQTSTYQGLSFMFTATDPYCGIDLDRCRDPKTGRITPWAWQIIKQLDSYTEASPTTGIHIILRGSLKETTQTLGLTTIQHKNTTGNIEVYDEGRCFTMTGKHVEGTPTTIEDRQKVLTDLYFETFCVEDNSEVDNAQEERTPPAHLSSVTSSLSSHAPEGLDLSDQKLLDLAMNARGSNGLRFQRLWNGDTSEYRDTEGHPDESRADQALLGALAYWTDKDAYRMERLFKQSGLYSGRPERQRKWDAHARNGETYGSGSIRMAIANCTSTYNPNWRPAGWLPYEEYIARQSSLMGKQAFPQKQVSNQQGTESKMGGQGQ